MNNKDDIIQTELKDENISRSSPTPSSSSSTQSIHKSPTNTSKLFSKNPLKMNFFSCDFCGLSQSEEIVHNIYHQNTQKRPKQ